MKNSISVIVKAFEEGKAVRVGDTLYRFKDNKLQHKIKFIKNDTPQGDKWCECHSSVSRFFTTILISDVKVLVPKDK